ncbi:hypothetical protein [Leptothrix discophora]|uniref:Uncharacterized protein n=1 Tax=Leptothrix discophora TaxID=89 RepID=A0ABT9FZF6_LEPDI|nr:hypothetical protein [Leptothrix discophora]MDP4299611.1 hypothetical protein [Leptothrix discophora]
MQAELVGLHVTGCRTLTSKSGHRPTAIQTLGLSVNLPQTQVILRDALRKLRNLPDHAGDLL